MCLLSRFLDKYLASTHYLFPKEAQRHPRSFSEIPTFYRNCENYVQMWQVVSPSPSDYGVGNQTAMDASQV
jgi:hypothetical protein